MLFRSSAMERGDQVEMMSENLNTSLSRPRERDGACETLAPLPTAYVSLYSGLVHVYLRCDAAGASLWTQYSSSIAWAAVHLRSALGRIILRRSFSSPLDIFHVPTHLPRSYTECIRG